MIFKNNDTNNISSVYSPFSDRAKLPLHNIPSPGVLVTSTCVIVVFMTGYPC